MVHMDKTTEELAEEARGHLRAAFSVVNSIPHDLFGGLLAQSQRTMADAYRLLGELVGEPFEDDGVAA